MLDLNPLHWLGDKAKEGLADGWTAAMISLWSAGMWLLEAVFKVLDKFLTPDVRDSGLTHLYGVTVWISLLIALMIGLGQIALAAIRRDGTSLGSLASGIAQYGAVVTCWVALCGAMILGCTGLTTGLLEVLLDIDDFSGYQTGAGWPDKVSGTVAATALGMCSLFLLIPAGFGYVLIMLVREAALLVLTATMPIAAAGALGEGTRAWMWKSIRWFTAACLTAPLLALVLGVGVQITRAAFPDGARTATGMDQTGIVDSSSQVGMAVVGCVIMVIACFCPMVLFRLLAFVDPGTGSGSSMRSTLAANGGVGGLLRTKPTAADGSGAATQTAADGRTASESSADAETSNRFQSKLTSPLGVLGPGGGAVGASMRTIGRVASQGAAMGVDVASQAGIGSQGYYDTTPPAPRDSQGRRRDGSGGTVPGQVRHGGSRDANDPIHVDPARGVADHPVPPAGLADEAADGAVFLA